MARVTRSRIGFSLRKRGDPYRADVLDWSSLLSSAAQQLETPVT